MRRAGRESWRFAHAIDQSLHTLLYMRDALDLDVDRGGSLPPRLKGDLPERSGLLDANSRQRAALEWPSWWDNVLGERVGFELASRPESTDQRRFWRELAERHRLFVDHPEWASLADRPALQAAARALWTEGCRWADAARRPLLPPTRHDIFRWDLVRDVAEDCAARNHVGIGAINGCALVLIVEGTWWELVAPGAAVCSVSAAVEPESAKAVLDEVFTSALTV
jgi:hypothetical protein